MALYKRVDKKEQGIREQYVKEFNKYKKKISGVPKVHRSKFMRAFPKYGEYKEAPFRTPSGTKPAPQKAKETGTTTRTKAVGRGLRVAGVSEEKIKKFRGK